MNDFDYCHADPLRLQYNATANVPWDIQYKAHKIP